MCHVARCLQILKELQHSNIVRLERAFVGVAEDGVISGDDILCNGLHTRVCVLQEPLSISSTIMPSTTYRCE